MGEDECGRFLRNRGFFLVVSWSLGTWEIFLFFVFRVVIGGVFVNVKVAICN